MVISPQRTPSLREENPTRNTGACEFPIIQAVVISPQRTPSLREENPHRITAMGHVETMKKGGAADETTMISDTMETDILGGVQLGFHTVLVLSGGTKREDLDRYAYRPEIVVEHLADFVEMLERHDWEPSWRQERELEFAVG